jgi:hypothetical protein
MKKRHEAALKAWRTRRIKGSWVKAHAAEAASKAAFEAHFTRNGWRVAFFEGATGSPRTGIIDAVAFRLSRGKSDVLDLRLVQLKGGKAGVSAKEIGRLKEAASAVVVNWLIAEYDSDTKTLYLLPNDPSL